MNDLDQAISDLKGQGKSLREIGRILRISHMTVSRKLKSTGQCYSVTEKDPSWDTGNAVTPSTDAVEGPLGHVQGGFEGIPCSLVEMIRGFLKRTGIEMYRLKGDSEVYQVKHKGQVIRFYVNGGGQ